MDTSVADDLKNVTTDSKSDHEKTVEMLMNGNYKRRKTIIPIKKVSLLTTLDVISQLRDVTFLKLFIDDYLEYLTSVGGIGRQDIVKISVYSGEQSEKRNSELLEILKGR